jgi:hypothetical protein
MASRWRGVEMILVADPIWGERMSIVRGTVLALVFTSVSIGLIRFVIPVRSILR